MKKKLGLIFEEKDYKNTVIYISPSKTFQEAINLYKIKANRANNEDLIFIYNGKKLHKSLTIAQSGLIDKSIILVVDENEIMGG